MEINKAVDVLEADLTNMYGKLMVEEDKRLELSYEALEMGVTALKTVHSCDICKHNSKKWSEEPCDWCCGANSGFELESKALK